MMTPTGVYLYDVATLDLQLTIPMNMSGASRVMWVGDNTIRIIAHGENYIVSLEDPLILQQPNYGISGFATTSPDGRYIALDYGIRDLQTGRLVLTFTDMNLGLLTWMPDNVHFVYFEHNRPVTIWNVQTGQVERELGNPIQYPEVVGADFSLDGRFFAFEVSVFGEMTGLTDPVVVWDLQTSRQIPITFLEGGPNDHNWRVDEGTIVLQTGSVVQVTHSEAQMTQLPAATWWSARLHDGLMATLGDAIIRFDSNFRPMDAADGFGIPGDLWFDSSISPDGQMVSIGSATRLYVWHVSTNALETVFEDITGIYASFSAWSPSGDVLAIGTHLNGQVHLWDARAHESLDTIQTDYFVCQMAWVNESAVAVSLTDRQAEIDEVPCVSGPFDDNYFLAVLDVLSGQYIHFEQTPGLGVSFKVSPDGRFVALEEVIYISYAVPPTIQVDILDTTQFRRILTIDLPSGESELRETFAWLPEPSMIAVIGGGQLRSINVETGESTIDRVAPAGGYCGQLLPIGSQFVQFDTCRDQLTWFDLSGYVTLDDWPFLAIIADPIVTSGGSILIAVSPAFASSEVMLLEILPPR